MLLTLIIWYHYTVIFFYSTWFLILWSQNNSTFWKLHAIVKNRRKIFNFSIFCLLISSYLSYLCIFTLIKGIFEELVLSLESNWSYAMQSCAIANQILSFEDDIVSNETWIGKARYSINWGKVNHTQFIKHFLSSSTKWNLIIYKEFCLSFNFVHTTVCMIVITWFDYDCFEGDI